MDSDEVNSIGDTTESYQIALLLKDVFYDLAVDLKLSEHQGLVPLQTSSDVTKPLIITVPENVSKIFNIKYNVQSIIDLEPWYTDVAFVPLDEFIKRSNALSNSISSAVDVMSVTQNGCTYTFSYYNNKAPQWYTHLDTSTILFDSFDNTVDSTIQESKILTTGMQYPIFTVSDTFIPPIDASQFSYYRNKAMVRAFLNFKQTQHPEAQAEARRQKITLQSNRDRTESYPAIHNAPSYGRK
jgi:hypothetical protein